MLLKGMKTNLWYRYISYYCIIFLIPFVILSIFVFQFSLKRVEEQFESSIKNSLNQSERLLSAKIEELDNIAMHIISEKYVSPSMMEHDYYGMMGKEVLSSYVASSVYLDDMILYYFSRDGKYYSSKGSYSDIDILIDRYYKNINISKHTLRDIFYLTTPQIILLPKNKNSIIQYEPYYIFPLYDSNGKQYGSVAFLFNKERLKSILPKYNEKNMNEIYIVNKSGSVLLNNDGYDYRKFVNDKGQIKKEILNNNSYKDGDTQYSVLEFNSNKLGFKFVSIIDNKDLVSSLIDTKILIFKLLILLFFLGIIVIIAMSYFQYLPIMKIHRALGNKKREKMDIYKKNELESIEKLVTDIIDENNELLVKNKALDKMDENQLLLEIIEGVSNHREKIHPFIEKLESTGYEYYIILIKKYQLSEYSKTLAYEMLPIDKVNYLAIMIQIPLQDKLGILVIHREENITQEESLTDIQKHISILKEDIYYYCGGVYKELSKVNHSYIEAMVACDYLINDIKDKFIFYKSVSYSKDCFLKYPTDIEEKLEHGIKQGTEEVVSDSLKQIFNFIYLNKYCLEEIKIYSYYLINFILKCASSVDFQREKIKLKTITEYRTLEELELNLLDLVYDINRFVRSKRSKARDKFREDIFMYILKNYTSHDLSLELLSKKYDYSVSYLSKMIKEETGMTFTKYIQELRFNYVKNELIKTELPIKEIIFKVGYYDVPNFSRKFKMVVGVTPGQFRMMHKKEKTIDTSKE